MRGADVPCLDSSEVALQDDTIFVGYDQEP